MTVALAERGRALRSRHSLRNRTERALSIRLGDYDHERWWRGNFAQEPISFVERVPASGSPVGPLALTTDLSDHRWTFSKSLFAEN